MDKDLAGNIRFTTAPVYRRKKPEVPSLYLSPSSIAVFTQCRQRYKFLYLDKLGDKYGKPRPYFTMANHIHATLRDFLSLRPVSLRTTAAIEKLLQRNWQRYRVGFRDENDEKKWAEKALAQVRAFVTNHDVRAQPLMMEEFMEVEITHGFVLRGRIDRVDREPDGSLHIIDYKTGSMPQEMDWTQLELHALITSKRLPRPVSRVSYLYLGPSLMQSATVSTEELRQVHWGVLNTARKVRRERKFRPAPGLWCGNCNFISICPSKTEAEPLAMASGQLELWDDLTQSQEIGNGP